MTLNGQSILKLAGYVTALSVIGGAGWAVGEVTQLRPALIGEVKAGFQLAMEDAQRNRIANAAQDFRWLEERLKRGDVLSWEEKRDFCTNAWVLDYPVSGSYGISCTKDGKPDLVTTVPAQ